MEIKLKPCKSQGKAKPFKGCGTPSLKRTYGLCDKCLRIWATTTEEGGEWLRKQTAYKVKSNEKTKKKETRIQTREKKIRLLTPDKYRAKYLQPVINKIARLIDYGQPCIASGNVDGKMAGGHYLSVGSNRTTALNLHNIHIQAFESNTYRGGDDKRYRENLIRIYGQEYFDFVDQLRQHKPLNLTLDDMIELKNKASKIALDIEKTKMVLSTKERIRNRNIVNNILGIYEVKFSTFKL